MQSKEKTPKKSAVWHESETNRMWNEINGCPNIDDLSPMAWSHLKKIARNMCDTDFNGKDKYNKLLNALLYKNGYELKEIKQIENEIKFITDCLYCAIVKCDGDTEKFFNDEHRIYTNDMINIYKNINAYEKEDKKMENIHINIERQFYRLLEKFNIKNKATKEDGKIDIRDILCFYENRINDYVEYGEQTSYTMIYKWLKDKPQRQRRMLEWALNKQKQKEAKQSD